MYQARIICLLAGTFAFAGPAIGAEMGLGIAFDRNTATIYAPIALTSNLRVEPYLSFYSVKSTTTNSNNLSTSTSASTFGAGVFATRRFTENVELFAGARLAYVSRKQDYSSSVVDSSRSTSGYLIAPTIGVEYFLQMNISIGAEAAFFYSRTSGHDNYGSPPPPTGSDIKESSTGTSTAVTIRYYFK